MNAFFCATPLHIFTSVNMKIQIFEDVPSDIYILNHVKGNAEVAKQLSKLHLFENVILVDNLEFTRRIPKSRSSFIRKFKLIKWLSSYNKISEKYFSFNDKTYDRIFIGVFDIMFKMAIRALLKKNDIEINLFEDGAGSYKTEHFEIKGSSKYIFSLLGYDQTIEYNNLYLSKPELYSGKTSANVRKIPSISSKNDKLKMVLNEVFGYKEDYSIKDRIIFFEQPLNEVKEELGLKFEIIFKEIIKSSSVNNNYLVKMHPRSVTSAYNDFNLFKNILIPWEIIDMNFLSSDSVLVSYYSTTCFTSKLIFDKEPFIIFLYNLFEFGDVDILNEDLLNFAEKFKNSYSNPEKIFIPQNMKELNSIFENILKNKEVF